MLSASFFRLGVEQRVREIGTLRALGFSISTVRRAFLAEGAVLLAIGSLVGVLGALAYGGALVDRAAHVVGRGRRHRAPVAAPVLA